MGVFPKETYEIRAEHLLWPLLATAPPDKKAHGIVVGVFAMHKDLGLLKRCV